MENKTVNSDDSVKSNGAHGSGDKPLFHKVQSAVESMGNIRNLIDSVHCTYAGLCYSKKSVIATFTYTRFSLHSV